MPKIRDLGVNTIAPADMIQACGIQSINPPQQPCAPSPPQCHPSGPNQPKYVGGLPPHAVMQLKQELRQHVAGQLHA